MEQELALAPGDQQLVIGELAGYDRPRPTAASVPEFVGALPPAQVEHLQGGPIVHPHHRHNTNHDA